MFATAEYDAWLAEEPAARLTRLLIAWLQSTTEPYTDAMARVPALVESEDANPMLALVRRELLTAANRLPSDRGLVSDDGLAAVIAWQMPGLRMEDAMLTSLWREARAMGIVAHGTLTPLGRALATADEDQLIDAARDLVGTPTTSAIFQADLTAVVPGIPAYTLASLLDSAADRESRGGALIWRFSSASVRRALDAGIAAGELTTQLTAVSSGGVIPQPLVYLIGDIGRRHGGVRVRDVGCVIHGLDEALLTEILSVKALRKLGLTRLAPTVLAAASPQGETLDALRAAGYLPAAEQADGNPHLPSTVQQRASTAPQLPFTSAALDPAGQPDPYDLARQLCGRPPGKEPRYRAQPPGLPFGLIDPNEIPFGFDDGDDDPGGYPGSEEHALLHHAIEEYADSLDPKGVCQLATAIEFGEPVRVTYRPIGSRTKLRAVVELETIDGEHVRGRDLISGRPVKLQLGAIERIHQV